ncbi:MAG: hypothetical protein KDJ36_12620, partial [Hyphomicrobiaceae bacterium]|nr:hypothetical protein [Hyphomicrobiaceae bacterium]
MPQRQDFATASADALLQAVRFWNNDVLNNTEGVLQVILERLHKAPSPGLRFAKSDLSPQGEVTGADMSQRG